MTIQTKNLEIKSKTDARLARIEGQLRGVRKMIDENRDCKDIVQQLVAIRSAIQSASLDFIQAVAKDCLLKPSDSQDASSQQALLADLIRMLGKIS